MSRRVALVLSMAPVLSMVLVLWCGRIARADDYDNEPADNDGANALAERFSAFSYQMLRSEKVSPAVWRLSAALLQGACRLNPSEPRFARLLADDMLRMHDTAGAVAAIKAYRQLKPDDQLAQTQQIDLYLGQMQTADEKIDYVRKLLDKQMIPAEVRSFAAMRGAKFMLQRSENEAALKMLDTALALNHLNVPALRTKYDLTNATAMPMERVGELLALVRANPVDPVVVTRLAQQLADVGLVGQSINWFGYANAVYGRLGYQPDSQFARGVASELVLAGKDDDALKFLDQYLGAVPEDADGWFLRIAILKHATDPKKVDQVKDIQKKDDPKKDDQKKDAAPTDEQKKDDQAKYNENIKQTYDKALRQAGISLTNRLMEIRQTAGESTATTRPIDSTTDATLPDLSNDVGLLQKTGRPDLASAYIDAAATLAWFDLYCKRDVAAADPVLAVLGKFLPETDVLLVRLLGWRELANGNGDAAAIKLSAVQDRDPYAALGMIQINQAIPGKHDEAVASAKKLMASNLSGVIGAILYTDLRGLGAEISPSASAGPIATALSAFPMDYLQIIEQPTNFYSIHAEPTKPSYDYGEPILVRVTIQNIGSDDLNIGPDAVLHPDLWFDAQLRGQMQQVLFGVAFDEISSRLVLPVGQSMTTTVRADSGALNDVLRANPISAVPMNMTVQTNPQLMGGSGKQVQAHPGPAGYKVQLNDLVQRSGAPLGNADGRAKYLEQLTSGTGAQKIRTLEAIAGVAIGINGNPQSTADAKTVANDLIDRIKKAAADPAKPVQAWAVYMQATVTPAAGRPAVISQLAQSPDWEGRVLAMLLAPVLPDKGAALTAQLSNDADPIVHDVANSLAEIITEEAAPATTEPSGR